MLVLILIPCRCSKVVILLLFFFNHYQVRPMVLYYSCSTFLSSKVHQATAFRLLFNVENFFFLIITILELQQEQKSTKKRYRELRKKNCLLCRGANKAFQVIIILLVKKFESSRWAAPPPWPSSLRPQVSCLSYHGIIYQKLLLLLFRTHTCVHIRALWVPS